MAATKTPKKRQTMPPPQPETSVPTPAGKPVIEGLLRPIKVAADSLLSLSDALSIAYRQLPPADQQLLHDLAEDVQTMAAALTRYRDRTRELVPPPAPRGNARFSRFADATAAPTTFTSQEG